MATNKAEIICTYKDRKKELLTFLLAKPKDQPALFRKIINNEFFYNQEQSEFLKKIKTKYSSKSIINFLDKLNDLT